MDGGEETSLRSGYKLDRYELICPIASGGMARVWLARLRGKRGFEKLFAVKTIKTDLVQDPRFQELFLDEARLASGIQHPNVAQILDLGETGEVLYIVMEWVDGDALTQVKKACAKQGVPLPIGVTLRIAADTCAGLHAAHELRDQRGKRLGVVHRDVSPHNILVSGAGNVKVIDFGIAKATARTATTRDGIVKGKVRYMAPEQVNSRPIDRRADIWAMGVCLYEMVTGTVPFEAESDIEVVRRLMSAEPPPLPPRGAMPDVVEQIIDRSVVRDPGVRFATAALMQRAIETAIDDLGLDASNEDVAEFLRANAPDLEERRRRMVASGLDAMRARDRSGPALDDAEPLPASEERPFALAATGTPRKTAVPPRARPPTPPPPEEVKDSKVTPAASLLVGERESGGGGWIWALVVVAGVAVGAWFVWPGEARLRALAGMTPSPSAAPSVSAPMPAPSAATTVLDAGEFDALQEAGATSSPHGPSPSPIPSPIPTPTPTPT